MSDHAVGIDPDSLACVVAHSSRSGSKPRIRQFSLSHDGLEQLTQFLHTLPGCLVGIEGRRGQSTPLEAHFQEKGIRFYSIPASKIDGYRNAMVSTNKNNGNDALAVAIFLLDAESRGDLERYISGEEVDFGLRMISRARLRLVQDITEHSSTLWKLLKHTANDLYLALLGKGDDLTSKPKITSKRLLHLIVARPELMSWKNLTEAEILSLSGAHKVRGWENLLVIISATRHLTRPISIQDQLLLKQTAQMLLLLLEQKEELEESIEKMVEERPVVKALRDHYSGMGSVTAALIMEELITLQRFQNDDHLASYAGLTKRDHSTGTGSRQVHTRQCNRRLKYAFLNFAKAFLMNNPDHHLTKYRSHLLKRGMSRMESLMRTARALVRDLYRFLKQEMNGVKGSEVPTEKPAETKREPVAKDTRSKSQRPYKLHGTPKENLIRIGKTFQPEVQMA